MPNRVSRRERRRRLYYLRAVCERMLQSGVQFPAELPAAFNVTLDEFLAWCNGGKPIPLWIVQLAQRAYRIPEPPKRGRRIRWLVVGILVVVAAGIAAVLALAR